MTGVSTLGQALRQISNLQTQQLQLADLSTQLATGKKTQNFSGLKTDALTSLRARADLSSVEVYVNNIKRADATISLTLNTIEEFQAQAQEISKTMTNFLQEGDHLSGVDVLYDDPATTGEDDIVVGKTSSELDTSFQAIINHADNLFGFLGEMFNVREGDQYLLAGADTLNKPYNDTGTLDAAISTLIVDWKNGAITTDELVSDLFDGTALNGNNNAITDSTIGYSSSLSNGTAGDVFVRTDDNSEIKYTAEANEKGFRDIMVAMAVLKNSNLPPIIDVYENGVYPGVPDAQGAPGATAAEQKDNFYKLYNEMAQRVSTSIDGIDQTRFRLETVRVQMNETKESHISQKELLQNTVSNVEDVNINEVAVRITTLQTQLEASYSVTALTQKLTLANYIN